MSLCTRWSSFVLTLLSTVLTGYLLCSQVALAIHPHDTRQRAPSGSIASLHRAPEREHLPAHYYLTPNPLLIDRMFRSPLSRPVPVARVHEAPQSGNSGRIAHYTVKTGDTLWQLSLDYHTTVERLMQMNHLDSNLIVPGQNLKVFPSGHPAPHRSIDRTYDPAGPPAWLIPIYLAAGRRYGVPWTVLAAIHRVETDFSTAGEVSVSGAEGPLQFMPSTFIRYGVTAPGQSGAPDIDNVYDAIYSCAHMLQTDGYAQNPALALYLYNHSATYVRTVEKLASSMSY